MGNDIENYILQEGKKFMWDGLEYPGRGEAKSVEEEYRENGFETIVVEAGERFLVYSRRVVTEIDLGEK